MDVLIRSKIFQCERLPGDAAGDIKKFCTVSGLKMVKSCLDENEDTTAASECLVKSYDSVSASTQMAQCLCQSMFDAFFSSFSTSFLLCTKNFLGSERKQRFYDNWGEGWTKEAPEASSTATFTWSTKDLQQAFSFDFQFDSEKVPKSLDEFLSKFIYDDKTNAIVDNPKYGYPYKNKETMTTEKRRYSCVTRRAI